MIHNDVRFEVHGNPIRTPQKRSTSDLAVVYALLELVVTLSITTFLCCRRPPHTICCGDKVLVPMLKVREVITGCGKTVGEGPRHGSAIKSIIKGKDGFPAEA